MIKNPKIGQTVWFIDRYSNKLKKTKMKGVGSSSVHCANHLCFSREEIFPTESAAIQHALKIYNKKIQILTKKREKLASRLAEIIKER
jgi:3-methyladenine DNA glycosylase/8-oxoguanine DNA glycosylase